MGKKALVFLAATALLLGALSGVAWAHPAYKASSPPSGGSVSSPPSEVWVDFTEQIEGGRLEVFDACGDQVDNGDSTQNLTSDRLTVTLSASRAGTYRVDWSVLGSDGHQTKGSFTFSATVGEAGPGEDPPPEPEPRGGGGGPRGGGGGTDPEPDPAGGGGTARGTESQARGRGPSEGRADTGGSGAGRSGRIGAREDRARGAVAAPGEEAETEPTSDPGIWDGIPLGDFLVALGVAALIGAAGGRIYAGIMGPAPPR